jgi:hypothetical protein
MPKIAPSVELERIEKLIVQYPEGIGRERHYATARFRNQGAYFTKTFRFGLRLLEFSVWQQKAPSSLCGIIYFNTGTLSSVVLGA